VSIVLAVAPEPDTIGVPSVIGNFAADAEAKLSALGFQVISDTASSDQPAGVVIGQTPTGGTEVERGSQVVITVSSGPATTESVPTTPTTPTTPTDSTTTAGGAQVPAPELP
jgi:serine/threonine-protein kinase